MAYHTSVYLFVFLPLVLLTYQLTPRKKRWFPLLLAGYVFFWTFSGKLVVFLIGATLITYSIGLLLGEWKKRWLEEKKDTPKEKRTELKKRYKRLEKIALTAGILLLLSTLGYLKYYNFFAGNVNRLVAALGGNGGLQFKDLAAPIGISFYTLQAIGYLADVYWDKVPPQQHLGKLALFLTFFPQIMEGPISLYGQTAEQLWKGDGIKGENLAAGSVRILWGLFKKMIIADRLFVVVQEVFDGYEQYHGVIVAAAAVAYTIQLYMEFSGCMDIVIGSGRLFGVTLPENFRQPFASGNAAEFWQRWHISLGTWFKTYIFYPVSVSALVKKWNRFGKKHVGKYGTMVGVSAMALFPVWLCNGLWHGANWNYLFYGMYYFVILLAGVILEPLRTRVIRDCRINEHALYWQIPRRLKTWLIIFTGELFFRANGLRAGIHMFFSIFQGFELEKLWDGTMLKFGLRLADYLAIAAGCVVVALVGMIKERKLLGDEGLRKLKTPVRWAVYYGLILAVVIFGAYGIGYQQVDLIYAGF